MRIFTLLSLCTALGLAGCASSTMNSATGVDRRQLLLVSSDQINQAAAQGYQQTLTEARQKGVLNPNAAQLQRVQRIANRYVDEAPAVRYEDDTRATR